MTRDEALKIIRDTADGVWPDSLVDGFVALGVLKLDDPKGPFVEPKGPNQRAVEAMFKGSTGGMITPRHALDALSAAGLQIIEKGQ